MSDDNGIPTPSPIPTPPEPWSLSERINAATRPTHSQLNRLITARLPLALPPYTSDPSVYLTGILHIAPIYITFESLWQSILDAPHMPTSVKQAHTFDACDPDAPKFDAKSIPIISNDDKPPLIHHPPVCSRTHSLLSHLRLPGLVRSGRLRADICTLTNTADHEIEAKVAGIGVDGKLGEFISHTKNSVQANPHVLLAYAWVFYMALFAGGRFLRASLRRAGPEFWSAEANGLNLHAVMHDWHALNSNDGVKTKKLKARPRNMSSSDPSLDNGNSGLQFFHFLGDEDGEDIKLEFKKRITEAECLLTSGEKEDIVVEAQEIFYRMIEVVNELDEICMSMDSSDESPELSKQVEYADEHAGAIMRSRNSVFITEERLRRKRKIITPNKDGGHRSSAWEVLVSGPARKLVRFNLGVDLESLRRRFSRQESRISVSGLSGGSVNDNGRRASVVDILSMEVVVYAVFLFLAVLVWLLL